MARFHLQVILQACLLLFISLIKLNDIYAQSPGGVGGAKIWVRANTGFTYTTTAGAVGWNDQSGNANNAVVDQGEPGQAINTPGALMNFNPAIEFDGSDMYRFSTNVSSDYTLIGVGQMYSTSKQRVFSAENFNALMGFHGGYEDVLYINNTPSLLSTNGVVATNNPHIYNLTRQATGAYNFYREGTQKFSGASSDGTAWQPSLGGYGLGNSEMSQVWIPEFIAYDVALTTTQRIQVESYLAIKYGVTLLQTTPTNYVASDGTTIMWNATTGVSFKANIAGIGRDDASGLNQKQSVSGNSANEVVIGLGSIAATNAANSNTFGADKTFMTWGDNGLSSSSFTLLTSGTGLPSGINSYRLSKIWRVQEVGTVGNVQVAIPASLFPGQAYLVVSNTSDLSSGNTLTALSTTTINGASYYVGTVNFNDGDYFSFSAQAPSPGGVASGNTLWIKADGDIVDPNTSVTSWKSQSLGANFALQMCLTKSSDPDLQDNIYNFNPAVNFDGDDYFRAGNQGLIQPTATSGEVFMLANTTVANTVASGYPFQFGGSATNTFQYDFSDANVYDGFGTSLRRNWNPALGSPSRNVRLPLVYNIQSSPGNWTANFNSIQSFTNASNTVVFATSADNNTYVGASSGAAFIGNVGEIVLYNRVLSATERQKVNSYLAIKYGTSLGTNTSPVDYVSSNGTTIWTGSSTYQNSVAGIGRDDQSGLNQKQSFSTLTSNGVIISNGAIAASNQANSNNFSADNSFLLWGDNAGTTVLASSITNGAPSGLPSFRMGRIWRVQETGTVGNVQILISSAILPAGGYLVTSSDATFSSGNTFTTLTSTTYNGQSYFTATVNLSTNSYFTFAQQVVSPGGVTGASIWLKADQGFNYSATAGAIGWGDASGSSNYAVVDQGEPGTGAGTPGGIVNFNQAVNFDGNDMYRLNNTLTSDYTVLGIAQSYGTKARVFSTENTNSLFGYHGGFEDVLHLNAAPNFVTGGTSVASGNKLIPATNFTHLYNLTRQTTGAYNFYREGYQLYFGASSDAVGLQLSIGGFGRDNSEMSQVYVPEVIAFDVAITALQKQKIESYLGIKYGLQLLDNNAIPTSYYASDWNGTTGTVAWNTATTPGYNYGVTIIGRDDLSGLNQKQSKSASNAGLITMALGSTVQLTNDANANTFAADKVFSGFGDNRGSFAMWNQSGAPTNRRILERVWRVQETGTVGSVRIQIPDNSSSLTAKLPAEVTNVYLLVDADGDFTSGATSYTLTLSGTNWETDIDFTNGQYFTIATESIAVPAGIASSGLVNGVYYELYSGFEGTPEDGMGGTLKQYGYISDFQDIDDNFANEIGDNFAILTKAKLLITTAGTYTFQSLNTDDEAAIFIDGVLQAFNNNVTFNTPAISLTAGYHDVEFRWSDGTGANLGTLYYQGPDQATMGAIPSSRLFVNAIPVSGWYKADAGVTPSTDATAATSWLDNGPHANNLPNKSGTITYYNATEAQLINYNPSLNFNEGMFQSADDANGMAYRQQGRTMFLVARSNNSADAGQMIGYGADSYGNGSFLYNNGTTDTRYGGFSADLLFTPSQWVFQPTFGSVSSAPRLFSTSYTPYTLTTTENAMLYADGRKLTTTTTPVGRNWFAYPNDNFDVAMGGTPDGSIPGNTMIGNIAESLIFPWTMTAAERNRVESYLATKYGVSIDQTTPTNYTASDGSTLYWTASANGAYKNNITVIGRDDNAVLNQKQSKCTSVSGLVAIGLGTIASTNAGNTNTFAADKTFEAISDNGTLISWTGTTAPSGRSTLARTWRVQETGTVGSVRIQVPDNNSGQRVTLPLENSTVYLLLDADGNFSAGATEVAMTLNGTNWEADVNFTDGQYFTFATQTFSPAPGGVAINNVLWLRADMGVTGSGTVSGWNDLSPRSWHTLQPNATNQPVYNTSANLYNFNPVVTFDGTNDYLLNATNLASAITSNAIDAYVVTNITGGSANYSGIMSISASNGTLDYNNVGNAVLFRRNNGANNITTERNGSYGNATGITVGGTYLCEVGFNGANQYVQYTNGKSQAVTAYTNAAFNSSKFSVGCRMSASGGAVQEYIGANVAEIVLYDAANTSGNAKQRIRSYLAAKYGFTLDQTTPYDYLASDGTTKMWDATANSTYKNNITIIGRDDASALNQKQSKSRDNTVTTTQTIGMVTIGLGTIEATNAQNAATFGADRSFEAIGDNAASIAGWTGTTPPSGRRTMPRVWKVQETGTVGTVRVQVPDDGSSLPVKLPTEVANVYLLVSSSGTDFSTSTEYAMTLNGTNWEADVDFTDGQFFTFATFPQAAPGNVLANNVLWLKADAGVTTSAGTVTAWNDLSPRAWQATQVTVANQPVYNTSANLINYNPVVTFDGANDFFQNAVNLSTPITSNAVDAYIVGNITGGNSANAGGLSITNAGTLDNNVASNAVLFMRNNSANNFIAYRNSAYQGNTNGMTQGGTYIHEAGFNGSNQFVQSVNARNLATTAYTNTAFNVNRYSLGCRMSGAGGAVQEYMAGNIAEVIMYDAANTNATDRQKIRSYLAIKYGQTLDQTTPYNYITADGTVIWDATANAAYKNNITVIGRDDLSLLNQKQSRSQNNGVSNAGGMVVISKGSSITASNSVNNGTFTSDKSFIAFGDNGANTFYTQFAGTANCNVRMNRTWKVQRIGSDNGTVTLQVSDAAATHLLIYSDAALTTLVSETALSSSVATGVALSNGQFFTFGRYQSAPGGVISASGDINGLTYRLYDAFTASPALGVPGNLLQTGFIHSASNPENFLASERGDAFTIWLTGKLQIATGGNYTFSLVGIDDAAALFIDGSLVLTANNTTTTSSAISLTAGMHDIDVRYSDNTSTQVFELRYSGPDNSSVMGSIPDSRLFTSGAALGVWVKPDAGVSPNTDGATLSTWADQSSNRNNFTLNGGTPLLYTTTAANLLNFNPSVMFVNDEMMSIDNPNGLPIGRKGRTMYMVSTKTTGGSDHAVYHGNDQSNPGRFNFNSSAVTGGDNLILTNTATPLSTGLFWTINGAPRIAEAVYESPGVTATNNAALYADGVLSVQGTRDAATWSGTVVNDNGDFSVGTYVDGGTTSSGWDGMIPEVIYYPWQLSAADRVKVETYLAVKYGLTLGTPASPVSYTASNGTVLWTADAAYQNGILAIGRDDISGLLQKQSKTPTGTVVLTMALGGSIAATNAANSGNIASNIQFLAVGDNGATNTFTNYTGTNVNARLQRTWKVQETNGDLGNVTIRIAGVPGITHFLLSTTAGFTSGTVTEIAVNGSQEVTVNLASGNYFSFGRNVTAPAGVVTGLSLWYKADAGVNINGSNNFISGAGAWHDQSPFDRDIDFVNSDPQISAGGLNYNPVVIFDGDDYMRIDAAPNNTFYTALTSGDVFSVVRSYSNNAQRGFPYYFGGPSSAFGHHYTWDNGNIYTGFGTDVRKAWNPSTQALVEGASASVQGPAVDALRYHVFNQHSATNDWRAYFDGRQQYQSLSSNANFSSNGNVHLGASPGNVFYGEVPEYILYNRVLSATEKQQIASYLAVRYGTTLDQTVATNYIASDGSIIWNATSAGTYNKDIAIIGRDDVGGINQKQSKSVNTSGLVAVALGSTVQATNALNTNTFSANKIFMGVADNGGSITAWANTASPLGRMIVGRTWKVQETGSVGTVRLQVPDNSSVLATKLPAENTNVYLVTDADGDFTSGATLTSMTLNGTNWEVDVNFTDGMFFTIGTNEPNPVAGTLTSNQTCGATSATLTLTGFTGKIQWQTSTDGITWTNTGGLTTTPTLAVSPSVTTFYRAEVNSNLLTAISNMVIVTGSGTVTGDMTISQNITLLGTINLSGQFKVNSGVTVTVAQGCPLVVNAADIIVDGVINADAAGNLGGAGGGGAGAYANCGQEDDQLNTGGAGSGGTAAAGAGGGAGGANGTNSNGRSRKCGGLFCSGNDDGHYGGGGGGGAGAGGAYGGAGGAGGAGANGAWFNNGNNNTRGNGGAGGSASATQGTSGGFDIAMGFGGGGAGGGGSSNNAGSSGQAGGNGGGAVSLIATNTLSVAGTITANGGTGGTGGNGAPGSDGQWDCSKGSCGSCSVCGDETFAHDGGAGAGGGGGSGGGIFLQGFGNVTVTGTITANGGGGGAAGNPRSIAHGNCHGNVGGGAGGGGGRIKIVSNPCAANNINPLVATVTAGTGGAGDVAGNNGSAGTYVNNIIHPSYSPLVAGNVVTANQTVCTSGTPTSINADASTGGLGTFNYQWYVTKTACGNPTTGTGAAANNGWAGITANAATEDLSVAGIQQGIADFGGGTGTYCFQRRTQSGNCYDWTGVVSVTLSAQPTDPTSATPTPATSTVVCVGATLSVTAPTGGTDAGCQFEYRFQNAGSATWSAWGTTNSFTVTQTGSGASAAKIQVRRGACGSGCTESAGLLQYSWTTVADPLITADPVGTTLCPNNSYVMQVTASGGAPSLLYEWQFLNTASVVTNGTPTGVSYSGITTPSLTVTSSATTPNVTEPYWVKVSATGPGCDAAYSLGADVVFSTACSYVWTGLGVDDNWTTSGNWNIGVPVNGCGTPVTIPSGTPRNPVLTGNVTVGDITVGDSKIIYLSNNTLTTCGNWTGGTTNPSEVTGAGSVVLTGSTAQAISGRTKFETLRINKSAASTATVQSNSFIDVYTAVELQSGTLSTGTGRLTFKSNSASHIAVLDNFTSGFTGTLTGTIYAERSYASPSANSYNQHFMGSPVSNANLSQFGAGSTSGFVTPTANCDETQLESTSVYGSVFSYDQSNGDNCSMAGWKVEPGSVTATPSKGYSVAKTGSGTLTVNGLPNLAASYTQTGANDGWTNTTLQGHPMGSGWILVSNPYLATLDFTNLGAQSGFDAQIKVWVTHGPVAGSYQDATVIAPFQAFFIRNNVTGQQYTIDGALRTRNPQTFQMQANDHQLVITATNNNTSLIDITTVAFNSDATSGFDPDYDANKLSGSLGRHNLYTSNNGKWMSKNILRSIEETSTVNLNMEAGVTGSYTFNFDGLSSFDPTSYIMLEDKKLGTMYDVRNGDYNFTSDASDAWERFVLHFTPAAQVATTPQDCDAPGTITVTQPGTAVWSYQVTGSDTTVVGAGVLSNNDSITLIVPAGTYTLTLVDSNNYTVMKTITVAGTYTSPASFTSNTTTAETGDDVMFDCVTTNALEYEWDYGDGTVVTGQAPVTSHQYADSGTYTITLTITNADGCVSVATQTVTITQPVVSGIQNNGREPINIWSNANRVFVDFSGQGNVDATVEIYNVLGQLLVLEPFNRSSIYTRAINGLEAAYVIVRVKNEGEVKVKRVLVVNK